MKIYRKELIEKLKSNYSYDNIMCIPRLVKIVINRGLGGVLGSKKSLDVSIGELGLISGQKAVITRAKRSIANFKLRVGDVVGCKVTLRGNKMYEFLDRLVNIALPRVRDFRGLLFESFDGNGNYSLGIEEQIIFPEINYDKIERIDGMDIALVTTAKDDKQGLLLLKCLGFPFRN